MSLIGVVVTGTLVLSVCALSVTRPYAGIIGLLIIRGLWDATQWVAIPGVSWWSPLYQESGPYLLPATALIAALLVARLMIVPALIHGRARVLDLLGLLVVLTVFIGLLVAIIRENQIVRVFKDVAFLGGFLLVLAVSRLEKTQARNLFVAALLIAAISDLLAFGEALRRMRYIGQDLQAFLLHTYRIYKADHFAPLVILIGFFVAAPGEKSLRTRLLLALLVYYAMRFAFNFTRLNWLVLGATIAVYLIVRPTPRNLKYVAGMLLAGLLALSAMYVYTASSTGNWNVADLPLIQRLASIDLTNSQTIRQDISIRFRLTESRILLESFATSPLVGTGFGSTISPNDPDEPLRNNISDFFNGYFGLLHKVGLIGTLALISFLGAIFAHLIAMQRRLTRGFDYALLNAALLYCIGIALIGVVSDILFSNFYSITYAVIVGSALSIGKPDRTVMPAPPRNELAEAPVCA